MAENFYGITDTGKMRDNNEDNFIAQKILNDKYIAGCVIDGVGGYDGGEIAASIARAAILNTIKKSTENIIENLKKAFATANAAIYEKKQKSGEHLQMACVATLTLANITNNTFHYAHVGDTRLYLFRDNSLVKVSHDHSFVGFLEENGRLTEEAAMNHPRRNEINKALGFDDSGKFSEPDYIETGESPFLPGDVLLLCSDGLYDMLDSKTITGILNSPASLKEKSKELINAANLAGGKDNITVVLIQNDKAPLQQEATKPVIIKKNEPEKIETKEETINRDEVVVKKRSGIGRRFFAVLFLLLLAALAWFVYNDYIKPKNPLAVMPPFVEIQNTQTKILLDSLQRTTKQLWFKNLFGQYRDIPVNDTLLIEKDTLHINGNGAILIADSGYNGIGMLIASECKYISIDSLTFENFSTAIVVHNKVLHLKNVHFVNCKSSIVYNMQLPDDMNISGVLSDSSLIKTDTARARTSNKTTR